MSHLPRHHQSTRSRRSRPEHNQTLPQTSGVGDDLLLGRRIDFHLMPKEDLALALAPVDAGAVAAWSLDVLEVGLFFS